jgi:hypothetical protein
MMHTPPRVFCAKSTELTEKTGDREFGDAKRVRKSMKTKEKDNAEMRSGQRMRTEAGSLGRAGAGET